MIWRQTLTAEYIGQDLHPNSIPLNFLRSHYTVFFPFFFIPGRVPLPHLHCCCCHAAGWLGVRFTILGISRYHYSVVEEDVDDNNAALTVERGAVL